MGQKGRNENRICGMGKGVYWMRMMRIVLTVVRREKKKVKRRLCRVL